jgi:5-formyltetrahydrofolate cyclo-ligase
MTIPELKAELRRQIMAELRAMSPETRATDSALACSRLARQEIWQQTRVVLCYAPMPSELDIWPLVLEGQAAGKAICLPRYVPEKRLYEAGLVQDFRGDLRRGRLGIWEPGPHCPAWPLKRLDLVLAPGVGFDLNGWRLGRGKGYYDQMLPAVGGTKCGVAFDAQVRAALPVESHEARLDCILTPTRWLVAGQGPV